MTATNMLPRTLRAGSLAYLETLAGLIPCRVLRVWRADEYPTMRADVVLTATRGAYRKGERLTYAAKDCPPRDAIRRRGGIGYVQRFTCIEG